MVCKGTEVRKSLGIQAPELQASRMVYVQAGSASWQVGAESLAGLEDFGKQAKTMDSLLTAMGGMGETKARQCLI